MENRRCFASRAGWNPEAFPYDAGGAAACHYGFGAEANQHGGGNRDTRITSLGEPGSATTWSEETCTWPR